MIKKGVDHLTVIFHLLLNTLVPTSDGGSLERRTFTISTVW
jgi:hypothetical protein